MDDTLPLSGSVDFLPEGDTVGFCIFLMWNWVTEKTRCYRQIFILKPTYFGWHYIIYFGTLNLSSWIKFNNLCGITDTWDGNFCLCDGGISGWPFYHMCGYGKQGFPSAWVECLYKYSQTKTYPTAKLDLTKLSPKKCTPDLSKLVIYWPVSSGDF